MRTVWVAIIGTIFGTVALVGCDRKSSDDRKASSSSSGRKSAGGQSSNTPPPTFNEARKEFTTRLTRKESAHEALPQPPKSAGIQAVKYDSPAGQLSAYLTRIPKDGKKHPAIVWVFGGFDNGIGETAWEPQTPDNDQSASAFRRAGIVTLYPSFRGGNDNPGHRETFVGEVDDLLAAADFLAKQEGVDPNRIYLGGHSTGGTMALLAAAASGTRFRAVFASGPIDNVANYGQDSLPFDADDKAETLIRSPIYWLDDIKTRTFVFEGTGSPGNIGPLKAMMKANTNSKITFHAVGGYNHFSVLAKLTRDIAAKIGKDTNEESNIEF